MNLRMIKNILLLVCTLNANVAFSQISDSSFVPRKNPITITPYFNSKLFIDTEIVTIRGRLPFSKDTVNYEKFYSDSSMANFFSEVLFCADEKPLPSKDNKTFYRFTWLRSLSYNDIVIKLFEKGQEIFIETKYLRTSKVKLKQLPRAKLEEFEKLLDLNKFWLIKPAVAFIRGTDGSQWLIEGQKRNKFHFVYRSTPQGDLIFAIGVWLIENSDASNEEIY